MSVIGVRRIESNITHLRKPISPATAVRRSMLPICRCRKAAKGRYRKSSAILKAVTTNLFNTAEKKEIWVGVAAPALFRGGKIL
jgi:hypothetical protein